MKTITFIIPCYNGLNHTKNCVQSIIYNTKPGSYQFVFIDNGSTDGTPEYLSTVTNSHVIRNETNLYVNPAWNQGFKYVLEEKLGDYVCLCNNDIIVGRRWLDTIFDLFGSNRKEWYLPWDECSDLSVAAEMQSRPVKLKQVTEPFVGFCLFFTREMIECFFPIPECIRVLRGDDWITDCLVHNNNIPFRVSHCLLTHLGSATQSVMHSLWEVRDVDVAEFDNLCRTEYPKKGMKRIFDHRYRIKVL